MPKVVSSLKLIAEKTNHPKNTRVKIINNIFIHETPIILYLLLTLITFP